MDLRHSFELSSNLEEGAGAKERPFPRFTSSPHKTHEPFFSYDYSLSSPGATQSDYGFGLNDLSIESEHSGMRTNTVMQSDVLNMTPIPKQYLRRQYSCMDETPQRRIDAEPSLTRSWQESDLLRDEVRSLPPGENNPNAVPGGKLCFEYMNKGR